MNLVKLTYLLLEHLVWAVLVITVLAVSLSPADITTATDRY